MKKQEAYPLLQQLQKAAPKAAPAAAPKAAAPAAGAGAVKSNCFRTWQSCQSSSKRWTGSKSRRQRSYLESMKMEIPVVAPQDGTIASIDVAEGASVENGDTLATMN